MNHHPPGKAGEGLKTIALIKRAPNIRPSRLRRGDKIHIQHHPLSLPSLLRSSRDACDTGIPVE